MALRLRGLGESEAERQRHVRAFAALLARCLGDELQIGPTGRVERTGGEPDAAHRVVAALFDAIVEHPRLELTISVGRGQSDVVLDLYERREVDLDDLEQLPEEPTEDNPQIFTRCEALVHILAEYLFAMNDGLTRGSRGYSEAHRRAFRAQERHREANGQRGRPTNQSHDGGEDGVIEYEEDDGTTHTTRVDVAGGNITGVR